VVCGDVGSGKKPRVAIRGPVQGGDTQAAAPGSPHPRLLAPAHWRTLSERDFAPYPNQGGPADRFRTSSDARRSRRGSKAATVDCGGGHHSCWQGHQLEQLGLLWWMKNSVSVCSRKKKSKALRKDVDVLTLSYQHRFRATLYMSLFRACAK